MISALGPACRWPAAGSVRARESPVRIHPMFATAVIALVVVVGYNKFAGGSGHKMRVGP